MPLADQDLLFADVVERLRAAARDDREIDAARLHLLNLHEIMHSAGPHWPLLKDRIRVGSMGFLKGCLAEDDIVIPCGDGFLVVYAQGDFETLQRRTRELRVLLVEFYLGQEGLKQIKVEVGHHRAGAEDIGALIRPGETARPTPAPAIAPMFWPIWSAHGKVIASYICRPGAYDEGFAAEGVNSSQTYAACDLALLEAAHLALARAADAPRPGIGVSVHSSTLRHRPSRQAYLEQLALIPSDQARRLFVKIAEIDRGAPLINVADWVGLLRSRVRTVLLEFHHTDQPPPALHELGIWGAGYRLPDAPVQEGARVAEYIRRLHIWGAALKRQRLRFFIDNPRRPGLVRVAVEAGASFVISEAFWPPALAPGGVIATSAPLVSAIPASAALLPSPPL